MEFSFQYYEAPGQIYGSFQKNQFTHHNYDLGLAKNTTYKSESYIWDCLYKPNVSVLPEPTLCFVYASVKENNVIVSQSKILYVYETSSFATNLNLVIQLQNGMLFLWCL